MTWSLKKWVFSSGGWTKHNIDFQQPQGVYFLKNYNELSESVTSDKKLRYFTDQNEPKVGPHENEYFEYFQILKYILQTVRLEKVDRKNRVICLVPMFPT